jgi:hypothetical protein
VWSVSFKLPSISHSHSCTIVSIGGQILRQHILVLKIVQTLQQCWWREFSINILFSDCSTSGPSNMNGFMLSSCTDNNLRPVDGFLLVLQSLRRCTSWCWSRCQWSAVVRMLNTGRVIAGGRRYVSSRQRLRTVHQQISMYITVCSPANNLHIPAWPIELKFDSHCEHTITTLMMWWRRWRPCMSMATTQQYSARSDDVRHQNGLWLAVVWRTVVKKRSR